MTVELSSAGSAAPDIRRVVHEVSTEAAARCGIDLSGFDPTASLEERLAWAKSHGFEIGAVLSRFSSKLQHSTTAQVRDCVQFAAALKVYVPPEFVCVDEGVSGRKMRRDGLQRMTAILEGKLARVLLVYKVSRLFRVAYRGFQYFQEQVVEDGLRAVSVSQGIDTADEKTWKQLCYLHGIMDEMLISTIADHVRSGIAGLFEAGFVTGALTIGYSAQEVAGARPTNRGRPRTRPAVDPVVASLIQQHYEWIHDGLPLREGWRRWVQANGPRDPRSTSDHLTYPAYRRLLSNPRYIGCWAFGRKRNVWSSKRDYTMQVERPETEVRIVQNEELRIVSDELFYAVQERLAALKTGPRAPKRRKQVRLWDLVTACFSCAACSTAENPVRMHQAGANGRGMRCKRGDLCPSLTVIRRDEAVQSICEKLTELVNQDAELIEQAILHSQQIDAAGDATVRSNLERVDRRIAVLTWRISDLTDMAGEGSDEDRAQLKAKVRAAQHERAGLQAERSRLEKVLDGTAALLSPERVREVLGNLAALLANPASGTLGEDAVYRAATVFELLVGARIDVQVERRPGRKRANVRGAFTPSLLKTVQSELGDPRPIEATSSSTVEVWLRQPPRKDLLADAVHRLIDIEEHSFRSAAQVLQSQGHRINSGVVWQIRERYWEMAGQPAPKRPYNNGRPRESASS